MKLVIAEKPSVGLAIAKVLGATTRQDGYYEGNGYYISWCLGHLVELATAENYGEQYSNWHFEDLPIIPNDWQFKISKGKEKQMNIIARLMRKKEVDTIICATDAGREGELIFRLVYNKISTNKPVKRLWISSLEDEAISNGFSNLCDSKEYDNLYQAALCRAKADWLIGINATRLFTVSYGQLLNIGRVMSPTLSMIVERYLSVLAFEPEALYTVVLDCGNFTLSSEKLKDKALAEAMQNACNGQSVLIEMVERKDKSEKPPKLYDLTTLQREANKILGFTAEQTLGYTQSLYEQKLVTYPRTDSRFLTNDMVDSVPAVINASVGVFTSENINIPMNISQVVNNSKVTDHHAIIPTLKVSETDLNSLPFGEREVLKLIAIRLLVGVGENHIYAETVITGKCADYTFTTKGKTVLFNGFKDIQKLYKEQEEKAEPPLPKLEKGNIFNTTSSIKEGKTSPPKNYTDDTLLSAMENANNSEVDSDMKGIGTPATRAGIIEKLIKVQLVERKGEKKVKYFVPTEKGISLVTVLPIDLTSPLLTAEWEEKLKEIEQGLLSAEDFIKEINDMTTSLVKTFEVVNGSETLFPKQNKSKKIGICPRCGADVLENKKGFCCASKECKFAIWKENRFFTAKKKTVTKALATELLSKGEARLKDCYSEKTGKTYNCTVVLDDTGDKYVNFKIKFDEK
ncbi:MAG: DNA topoisomerase 3 [Clostridia bacterium]